MAQTKEVKEERRLHFFAASSLYFKEVYFFLGLFSTLWTTADYSGGRRHTGGKDKVGWQ